MSAQPATALIGAKRQGLRLDPGQLHAVAQGIASGAWSEGQVAAFAMAVAWRGMSVDECRDFTLALRDSGQRLRWDDLPGPIFDKHSTGGVGDCVSLLLAPLLAACGGFVPMISGRGLGHTGGTLDKLESIPGYDVHPDAARMRAVVAAVGCAIVGQGTNLVPADQRLYAVRDVTATVDVPDLMVASILSKKLAGGASALVLDIKTGSGAQLPDVAAARALSDRMLAVADGSGLRLRIALTDMGQVLGRDAGNALEVRAVLDLLCDRGGCPRLRELTFALCAELLCMGEVTAGREEALLRLEHALSSGAAAERFARMVSGLGGPNDLLERPRHYLRDAPVRKPVLALETGTVVALDVRAIGQAVVALGGGREYSGQEIDFSVGLSKVVGRGESVAAGGVLAVVHARNESAADAAADAIQRAISLGAGPAPVVSLFDWYSPTKTAA